MDPCPILFMSYNFGKENESMRPELWVAIVFFAMGLKPLWFLEMLMKYKEATQFDAFLVSFAVVVGIPLGWLGIFGMPPKLCIGTAIVMYFSAMYLKYSSFSLNPMIERVVDKFDRRYTTEMVKKKFSLT